MPGPPAFALAEIAVPVPRFAALVYSVPPELEPWVVPGVRVRVPLGRRTAVGVVVGRTATAPAMEVKPIALVLDTEPVLPPDLLALARFAADYYLAPIGEVVRTLLPSDLPAWGERRAWLTAGGAIAPPRDALDARLRSELLAGGRMRLSELLARCPEAEVPARLERWREEGKLAAEDPERRGVRYRQAVELAPIEAPAREALCGRSEGARSVLDFLEAIGRPATVAEVESVAGVGASVVRRLVRLGALRQFAQPERLSMSRHVLPAGAATPPFELRSDQAEAFAALTRAVDRGAFALFLLRGVTGSGKTEVFLRAAQETLAAGRSALLLVPEIALVPALARAAEERFGSSLAVLHSGMSAAERHQEWERLRRGEARVVVGPRSALFAPLRRLGLVVVDEEQDPAYKQEKTPRYHGRDLALVRAREAGAVALLVSATPSLEARRSVELGRATELTLVARAGAGTLPEGILVDLRAEPGARRVGEVAISARLREEIGSALAAGDQVILLRNRRGYAPLLLCRACGEDFRCGDCGLPRTVHRREGILLCHYCGARGPVPEKCPACGAAALEAVGAGTERVEERLREIFPGASVDVLDRDAVRRKGSVAAVLERFQRGETRILVGTQMVSKGHHFPGVALAAVLSADAELGFPDFRAVERTYALLVQLAGRAGRGARPGRVVVQTHQPEHYAIRAALTHDDALFADHERRFRSAFGYPPYQKMIQLLAEDAARDRGLARLRDLIDRIAHGADGGAIRVTGPAPAPLERLRGRWRFQALLRSEDGPRLRRAVGAVLPPALDARLTVDVDPYQLL